MPLRLIPKLLDWRKDRFPHPKAARSPPLSKTECLSGKSSRTTFQTSGERFSLFKEERLRVHCQLAGGKHCQKDFSETLT